MVAPMAIIPEMQKTYLLNSLVVVLSGLGHRENQRDSSLMEARSGDSVQMRIFFELIMKAVHRKNLRQSKANYHVP